MDDVPLVKICQQCNKEFNKGKNVAMHTWLTRKYCSNACKFWHYRAHPQRLVNNKRGGLSAGINRNVTHREIWETYQEWKRDLAKAREVFRGMGKRVNRESARIRNKELKAAINADPEARAEFASYMEYYRKRAYAKKRLKECIESIASMKQDYKRFSSMLIDKKIATESDVFGALIIAAGLNCNSGKLKDICTELNIRNTGIKYAFVNLHNEGFIAGRRNKNKAKIQIPKKMIGKLNNGDLTLYKAFCRIGGDAPWMITNM